MQRQSSAAEDSVSQQRQSQRQWSATGADGGPDMVTSGSFRSGE